ncbi:hypothetical protein, partial [Streptomyces longwoodensis]|uniref:hypothetical protein n=1 Tax=Streptomyces longwoodensis TaxID=68231 RepID=UPI0033F443E2
GAEGHKAPLGIPGGIPRAPEFAWRRIRWGLCRAAGAALVLRVNLPGGKFWVRDWNSWFMYFAWRQNFLFLFVGPLARPLF